MTSLPPAGAGAPPGPLVRPDVQAFLDYVAASGAPAVDRLTPAQSRAMARNTAALADLPMGDIALVRDLAAPGPAGPIPLRLFDARPQRAPGPLLVFIHGGGFVFGDNDSYAPLCAEIARVLDLPVVSIGYRLAPEDPFPAAPDDCEAAARWIAENPVELGRVATGLALAGDSAGGGLAVVTAMALRDRPAALPVLAQWAIYPGVDLGGKYPSQITYGQDYLLTRDAMLWFNGLYKPDYLDWRASPIKGEMAGLPPTLVLTAGLDPLVDQGRALAAALVRAGVPTTYREAVGTIHGFLTLRKAIPSGQGDLAAALAQFRAIIAETEGERVLAEAAA